MSKHTPGPWPIVREKNGRTILQIGKCTADQYAGAVWLEVTEPDASLISAAPDLLEALEALVKSNEDHNARVSLIVGKPTGWHDGYLDKAHAAIAKARGEA